jgi:hypothetical protein
MTTIKQELEDAIAKAISIVYSERLEFYDAVIELITQCGVSDVEAFVALTAAASTKDGGSFNIEECLATLTKYHNAEDDDISRIVWEICENRAKRDFLTIQMANTFLKIEPEGKDTSFVGAVYDAEKVKCGPLTKEERETLRLRYPSHRED